MLEGPIATVDLAAIEHNLGRIRAHSDPAAGVMAAVKANGYGHGAVRVAKHLEGLAVSWFGVATPAEALELRDAGIGGSILVFSPVYTRLAQLVAAGVALTIAGPESLMALERADLPSRPSVHLKVDTGMGRLGLPPAEAIELALAVDRSPAVTLRGVWTHFARADEPELDTSQTQLESFRAFLAELERHGVQPELMHAANSAAAIAVPGSAFDLVRPGIALYGYHSGRELGVIEPGLIPALTLAAPVTFVKRVARGTAVSYGHNWSADRDTTIATVRCGYADGYPRSLSNIGRVRMHGRLAPVVGRVCMDQLFIDVGDMAVRVGDVVELFGPAGPTADDLAHAIGTISYELLTSLAPRVARRYVAG